MFTWTGLLLVYAVYLAVLAWSGSRFAHARAAAAVAVAAASGVWAWWWRAAGGETPLAPWLWVVVPSLAMLGAYRVSGTFFEAPDARLERRLREFDRVALEATGILRAYRSGPRVVREVFEAFYLMVYLALPVGAVVLIAGGRADALAQYWTIVFAAELSCYGMLPWLQTRPPRAFDSTTHAARGRPGPLRRLNLALLSHGSIQVNTVPSGHAAGAVAIGLAVITVMPGPGAALLVLATGITVATILGRYHYTADSILGVLVAIAAWTVFG